MRASQFAARLERSLRQRALPARPALFMAFGLFVAALVARSASASAHAGPGLGLSRAQIDFSGVDRAIQAAVSDGAFPGAVAAVGDASGVLYASAFGHYTNDGAPPPLNNGTNPLMDWNETYFDMASCTKVLATTTSVAKLIERGALHLDTKVTEILGPEYAANGKGDITMLNLLLHNAGYPGDPSPNYWDPAFGCPGNPLPNTTLFPCTEAAFASILNQTLDRPPNTKYVYSDLSFLTLGFVVGTISQPDMDPQKDFNPKCAEADRVGALSPAARVQCAFEAFVRANVVRPLSKNDAETSGFGFLPDRTFWARSAPTAVPRIENIGKHVLQGRVNDGNAFALGGIAGHAGFFARASDVFAYAHAYMFSDSILVNATTREKFTKMYNVSQSSRALGWNTNTAQAPDYGWGQSCGNLSEATYTHVGYTGTQLCLDPQRKIFTILLTNRVYPTDQNLKIHDARKAFNNAVVDALAAADRPAVEEPSQVQVGLQVLRDELSFSPLVGERVVVLTNPSGVFPDTLTHVVDALKSEKNVEIVGVLAPEHGFRGDRQAETGDPDRYLDKLTNLTVYSVYRKTPEQIASVLDAAGATCVLVDMQDAGVRLYTFVWTLHDVMAAVAARGNTRVVVLDRPNPIGAVDVAGPVLNMSCCQSRYGREPVAHQHGMTIGELSQLFAASLKVQNASVIAMKGYTRDMAWEDTGLPWVPPSPNLPSPAAARAYPSTVFIEATTVSEGRGTTTPFQVFGAPFLPSAGLAPALNAALPGCSGSGASNEACFRTNFYIPTFQKYNATVVAGVQWARRAPAPRFALRAAAEILTTIKSLSQEGKFAWDGSWFGTPGTELFDLYAGTPALRRAIDNGDAPTDIVAAFEAETQAFEARRKQFLLY